MRDIKYKAFLKDSHEMASLKTSKIYDVTEIDFKDKYVTIEDKKGMIDVVGFEDCELMQFTGLSDKNGVDIFEGDLLNYKTSVNGNWANNQFQNHTIIQAGFKDGCFVDTNTDRPLQESIYCIVHKNIKAEIVGNIHQNKELLNQ